MSSKSIIFYIIGALLFMQWSGIHLHINIDSSDAVPHLSQLHGLDQEHDEHESDIDVSLADISTSWFKLVQFFIVSALILFGLPAKSQTLRPPPLLRHFNSKHSYRRPVLRAPPQAC